MNKIKNKGFSLIELMVATSIFVVIMLSAMGALFILLDGSKEARALRISMDNVNFAMESMTRSIRMGKNYHCTNNLGFNGAMSGQSSQDCPDGDSAIVFTTHEGPRLGYKLEIISGRGVLKKCNDTNPSNCVDLISSEINVKDLKFFTFGSQNPSQQAGTYIIIKGEISIESGVVAFSLQTMVSARNF